MGGKSSQSQQQVSIPPEVLARYSAVNQRAEQTAQTPFTPYSYDPSAFVAPINPVQGAAINQAGTYANSAQPYYNRAIDYSVAGARSANAEPIGGQQIGQYMSPFLGSVVGTTMANLRQQQQQEQSGELGNQISRGAFGGDRGRIAQANLARQQGLATGQTVSGLLNQGYGQALQTAQQQQGVNLGAEQANLARQMQSGQAIANIGTGVQQAGLSGASGLLAAGTVPQQTQQAGLSALYNQFLQQQGYPFQVAQFLANIAEGTGALSGSTTSGTQPSSFFSDKRLKEDIETIGETYDGQKIVKFRYKGEPGKQIGLIAQDVEKHHPKAVGLAGGYKTVDYDQATKESARKGHYAEGGLAPRHGYALDGEVYDEVGSDPYGFLRTLKNQNAPYAEILKNSPAFSGQGAPSAGINIPTQSPPPAKPFAPPKPPPAQGPSPALQAVQAGSSLHSAGQGAEKLYDFTSKQLSPSDEPFTVGRGTPEQLASPDPETPVNVEPLDSVPVGEGEALAPGGEAAAQAAADTAASEAAAAAAADTAAATVGTTGAATEAVAGGAAAAAEAAAAEEAAAALAAETAAGLSLGPVGWAGLAAAALGSIFSSRGGAINHAKYSHGGLAPNSEGGVVHAGHAGQGYADGGDVDAMIKEMILASSKSVPYGGVGLYGKQNPSRAGAYQTALADLKKGRNVPGIGSVGVGSLAELRDPRYVAPVAAAKGGDISYRHNYDFGGSASILGGVPVGGLPYGTKKPMVPSNLTRQGKTQNMLAQGKFGTKGEASGGVVGHLQYEAGGLVPHMADGGSFDFATLLKMQQEMYGNTPGPKGGAGGLNIPQQQPQQRKLLAPGILPSAPESGFKQVVGAADSGAKFGENAAKFYDAGERAYNYANKKVEEYRAPGNANTALQQAQAEIDAAELEKYPVGMFNAESSGGLVPRHGYATYGEVDDPTELWDPESELKKRALTIEGLRNLEPNTGSGFAPILPRPAPVDRPYNSQESEAFRIGRIEDKQEGDRMRAYEAAQKVAADATAARARAADKTSREEDLGLGQSYARNAANADAQKAAADAAARALANPPMTPEQLNIMLTTPGSETPLGKSIRDLLRPEDPEARVKRLAEQGDPLSRREPTGGLDPQAQANLEAEKTALAAASPSKGIVSTANAAPAAAPAGLAPLPPARYVDTVPAGIDVPLAPGLAPDSVNTSTAGLAGSTPVDTTTPQNNPTKEERGLVSRLLGGIGDTVTSRDFLIPLLSGLGTMASSPSRYLGSAVLQGLAGGAQASEALRERSAEIEKTESESDTLQAAINRSAIVKNANNTYSVSVYDPAIRNFKMVDVPDRASALRLYNTTRPRPGSDQTPSASGQPTPVDAQAEADSRKALTAGLSQGTVDTLGANADRVRRGFSNQDASDAAETVKGIAAAGSAARSARNQLNNLGTTLTGATSSQSEAVFYETFLKNVVNPALKILKQDPLGAGTIASNEDVKKIIAALANIQNTPGGNPSVESLLNTLRQFPGETTSEGGKAKLMATALVENQRRINEADYMNKIKNIYQTPIEKGGYGLNADQVAVAMRDVQSEFYKQQENVLAEDRKILEQIYQRPTTNPKETLYQHLVKKGGKLDDAVLSRLEKDFTSQGFSPGSAKRLLGYFGG